MAYFTVRFNSRVIIYERKMFIRLATGEEEQIEIMPPTTQSPNKCLVSLWKVHYLYQLMPQFRLRKQGNVTKAIRAGALV